MTVKVVDSKDYSSTVNCQLNRDQSLPLLLLLLQTAADVVTLTPDIASLETLRPDVDDDADDDVTARHAVRTDDNLLLVQSATTNRELCSQLHQQPSRCQRMN